MSLHKPLRVGVDRVPSEPFVVHRESVRPEWIDYNGHMNVAYYVLVFDHASDALFDLVDMGAAYMRRTNNSAFVQELNVSYRQEVRLGDPLSLSLQMLDADARRLHYCLEMRHAEAGYLSAACELLTVHVDLGTRRSAPFPDGIRTRLEALVEAHRALPRPGHAGRVIGIRR